MATCKTTTSWRTFPSTCRRRPPARAESVRMETMRLTAYNLHLHYHKEPVRIRRATCERGKRTAATRPYETCVAIVFARYELVFIYIFFFFFFPLPFSIIRSDARKRRRRRRKNIARLYMARLLCARAPRKVTQKAQVVINTHKQMA